MAKDKPTGARVTDTRGVKPSQLTGKPWGGTPPTQKLPPSPKPPKKE